MLRDLLAGSDPCGSEPARESGTTASNYVDAALIAAMKKRFPTLGEESSLELSAKVAKGEMKW